MVPVDATRRPPVNSPGVTRSRMDRARARPAELPPTRPVFTRTSMGRPSTSSHRVWGTTPRKPIDGSSSRAPRTTLTVRDRPPRTGSTSRATTSPGWCVPITATRSRTSRIGSPSTATITSSVVSSPMEGPVTWARPTPVASYGSTPRWRRAAATAVDLDTRIRSRLKTRFSSRVRSPRTRSSSSRVNEPLIRASKYSQPLTVESCWTVVKYTSPTGSNRWPRVTTTRSLSDRTDPGLNTK